MGTLGVSLCPPCDLVLEVPTMLLLPFLALPVMAITITGSTLPAPQASLTREAEVTDSACSPPFYTTEV